MVVNSGGKLSGSKLSDCKLNDGKLSRKRIRTRLCVVDGDNMSSVGQV